MTHPVGIAPDAATWWPAGDPLVQRQSLTRLDAAGWTTLTAADGVGTWGAIPDLDLAPDGSVRVVALDRDSQELSTYVITIEAAAATE